ncbi:DUF4974 domain-containing protein [Pedobacter polaris]|uniref:DUF4974 domain-containing protein n=1 Tax=Pedobacter polaris TaxID=2571273 RepID=A0A4U1CIE4_9SPHI|nr:FecR family protein [Pedobacter polaris]TKC06637.1 DUF4974 domain-containing protein [Pedobacter polaris]
MENNIRLQLLISKYLDRSLSGAEKNELLGYFDDPVFLVEIEERFGMEYEQELGADEINDIRQMQLLQYVFQYETPDQEEQIRKVKLWPQIGIAAAVATIIISVGIWFYKNQNSVATDQLAWVNDVAPGKNGATLTLANGQKILIKDALTGNIATQSGVKISKTADGQIIYEIIEGNNGEITYNTLTTTRGEQTQVRLPDGTLVFLNAGSSLKYPTSFAKIGRRQVFLTGEGYFEVAKDKVHPFIVKTDQQEVEVLGTHFNISSYDDEPATRTTLAEGSVNIIANGINKTLKSGEQAVLVNNNLSVININPEDVVAWKNGLFVFNDESLESIMRKVSRWYDVEVYYQDKLPATSYLASLSRSKNLSTLINILEKSGDVHFKIQGRRVVVMK